MSGWSSSTRPQCIVLLTYGSCTEDHVEVDGGLPKLRLALLRLNVGGDNHAGCMTSRVLMLARGGCVKDVQLEMNIALGFPLIVFMYASTLLDGLLGAGHFVCRCQKLSM